MSIHTIFLVAFFIWSFPLSIFRSRFRKMVYRTNSWTINIKPFFWKELKVLFGFHDAYSVSDLKLVNFYRFYLSVYFLLLLGLLNV